MQGKQIKNPSLWSKGIRKLEMTPCMPWKC